MALLPCPRCGSPSRVLEARPLRRGHARRRRACDAAPCGYRFTTREAWIDDPDAVRESAIQAAIEAAKAAQEQAEKVIAVLRADGAAREEGSHEGVGTEGGERGAGDVPSV